MRALTMAGLLLLTLAAMAGALEDSRDIVLFGAVYDHAERHGGEAWFILNVKFGETERPWVCHLPAEAARQVGLFMATPEQPARLKVLGSLQFRRPHLRAAEGRCYVVCVNKIHVLAEVVIVR